MPFAEKDRLFAKLSKVADESKLRGEERIQYERDQKAYTDLYNIQLTAIKDGFAKGLAEGMAEGKAQGMAQGRAEALSEAQIAFAERLRKNGFD